MYIRDKRIYYMSFPIIFKYSAQCCLYAVNERLPTCLFYRSTLYNYSENILKKNSKFEAWGVEFFETDLN